MREERISMSQRERERLKVLQEIQQRHLTQVALPAGPHRRHDPAIAGRLLRGRIGRSDPPRPAASVRQGFPRPAASATARCVHPHQRAAAAWQRLAYTASSIRQYGLGE